MANTTSAKKATRKIARRTIINKSRRTQMRGAVRTVEEAIKNGDRDAALKAMVRPSALSCARSSSLAWVVRRVAWPPVAGTFHRSPSAVKTIVPFWTVGQR